MDTLPLFEIHKICRICLKSDLLVSIFSPTFLMRPIEMIEKLQIFKLQPDDNLPTLLCQSCLYRVLDAYNLQQLAEASEQRLRELVRSSGNTGCGFTLNAINQESTNFSSVSVQDGSTNCDPTEAIYANICDIFERNVPSNDIEVDTDDVLNDVEIDVSSLTRSEAEDTLSDGFHVNENYDMHHGFVDHNFDEQLDNTEHTTEIKENMPSLFNRRKRFNKVLKIPDKCVDCGKTFKYSGYLEAHRRTHTGERPFACKLCSRRFTQSSNLLLHQRTHTGERRFQCEICSSFFTTSSNLKAHKLTHKERRDFHCNLCELSFKSERELRRHEPVHKVVKDIICDMCKKAFTKRSYLNAHIASVHRGIRRHKCTECMKVFGNRSNLICHMRTHTGEKPFECKYCTWKFNQSSALVRHMKKHMKSKSDDADESAPRAEDSPIISPIINCTSTLLNNFMQHDDLLESNVAMTASLPHHTNFGLLHSLPNINTISHMSNNLIESALTGTDSTLSSTASLHAYDFTKDAILDFSTNQQHSQNLY